jgi:Mrp family chromosome partitioning ATPase
MSQADSFKSRIIDVAWSPAVAPNGNNDRGNGRYERSSVGRTTMPLASYEAARPPPSAAGEPPPPRREIITTLALSSPVYVMEEVQPEGLIDPRLIMLREPGSERARRFRVLQHRLFAEHDPRIVTVSSACAQEGKTTCAANLALALAEAPFSKVLLLDLNLVRPGVADLFRFEPADNVLTKLLRSEDAAAPYAVASLAGSGLQLAALPGALPAGKRLDRSLLGTLLQALRNVYDHVVIDASAVADGADANVAAECADAVVLAARAGQSKRTDLRQAIAQLRPANVVGTVLLDI